MRAAAMVLLFVLACDRTAERSPLHLRIAVIGRIYPLEPGQQPNNAALPAQDWVFDPLVGVAADGSLVPKLAAHVERLSGSAVRVRLRPSATFSDGSAVTAADVARSLPQAHAAVRADGESIVIEGRGAAVEPLLALHGIHKKTAAATIGAGPFVVVEQADRRMLLRRRVPRPNAIELVELLAWDTASEAFSQVLAGGADGAAEVPSRLAEFFEGVPHLRVLRGRSPSALGLALNQRRVDLPTRLALAASARASGLVEIAGREGCTPVEPLPDEAVRSLPSGSQLHVMAAQHDPRAQRVGLALRRWLGTRAGALEVLDATAAIGKLRSGEWDVMVLPILTLPRAMLADLFRTGAPLNFFGYFDPAADAAFAAADWPRAEQALAADPPFVALCNVERIAVVDARYRNAKVGPFGLLETLPDWEAAR